MSRFMFAIHFMHFVYVLPPVSMPPLIWIKVRSSVLHLVVCSFFVGNDVRMYVRMREMCVMYGTSVMSVRLVCLSVMLVGNVCNKLLPTPLSKAVCMYACMHACIFTYVCVYACATACSFACKACTCSCRVGTAIRVLCWG